MMVDPSVYANPFYLTVPPGMIWPSLIVAILACIVASQAVITGCFQVCSLSLHIYTFILTCAASIPNYETLLLPSG
jgi:KUP system potassium uptake protein